MSLRSDLDAAAMLLTRLPVRGTPSARAADAAWAWPVIGLLVGFVAAACGWLVWGFGATQAVAAAVTVAVSVLLSGALHEDGLADTADGLWGGGDRARRLEIMRDSRIGTYGTIALVLSLMLRWSLVATALMQGQFFAVVVTAALVSRAPMAVAMRWLPAARADGLSRGTGRPPARATYMAAGLAIGALALHGAHGLLAGALVVAALWGLGHLARTRIGGQTGDVLGAVQQFSEIAVLVALTSG
ncbi:adenosylcobinamide-GDP ribazoletransferase [uncultured Jannaschia sp.]|uniref:adenosylcobinamide-GDP ribazoletransferase n=1 Tax=uncultured Jannaschia sp. TaxID=293347 RepID=UPI002630C3ED|nr:adenosylcobinamide-GDP ribazoletransferase [uncultured Jannaschia sp.]